MRAAYTRSLPLVAFYVGVNDIYSRREWFLLPTLLLLLLVAACALFSPFIYTFRQDKIDLGRARGGGILCLDARRCFRLGGIAHLAERPKQLIFEPRHLTFSGDGTDAVFQNTTQWESAIR